MVIQVLGADRAWAMVDLGNLFNRMVVNPKSIRLLCLYILCYI